MKFFGKRYFSPAYTDAEHVETPVYATCVHCGEVIEEGDDGWVMPGSPVEATFHRYCFLRSIIGSVAHQQKRCSCYGGVGEDDPKLTPRQAAEAAAHEYALGFLEHPPSKPKRLLS